MPTGYTEDLYQGKDVSFRDFVLHCAMAFGVAAMQRDTGDREPKRLTDDYYKWEAKRYEEAQAEVAELNGRTEDAWKRAYREYCTDTANANRESRIRAAKVADAYQGMLAQVKAWDISDAKEELLPNLKKFMIDQIEMCGDEGKPYESAILDFDDWKRTELESAARMLNLSRESFASAEERLAGQQRAYDELMAHL